MTTLCVGGVCWRTSVPDYHVAGMGAPSTAPGGSPAPLQEMLPPSSTFRMISSQIRQRLLPNVM